jgi:hypothetical protein
MGCTYILSQHPIAAVNALHSVFNRAANLPDGEITPLWLFNEMLQIAPRFVANQGYNPTGFMTLGSKTTYQICHRVGVILPIYP